jgi:hypothetical protein
MFMLNDNLFQDGVGQVSIRLTVFLFTGREEAENGEDRRLCAVS